jgi:hypothetical protein
MEESLPCVRSLIATARAVCFYVAPVLHSINCEGTIDSVDEKSKVAVGTPGTKHVVACLFRQKSLRVCLT